MKKLFLVGLSAILLTVNQITGVSGQNVDTNQTNSVPDGRVLTNNIDGIDVPWDVLEYAQLKYEGHAVTKAQKITRNGQDIYRLRVDRDDLLNDYNSIALHYDLRWKLLGEEKYASPPPVSKPKPVTENNSEEPKDEQKPPENQEKPEPVNSDDEQEQREGGSGGRQSDSSDENDDTSEDSD